MRARKHLNGEADTFGSFAWLQPISQEAQFYVLHRYPEVLRYPLNVDSVAVLEVLRIR